MEITNKYGHAGRGCYPLHAGEVRVLNYARHPLPSGLIIARLIEIGQQTHSLVRNGSKELPTVYTRGQSQKAADELIGQLRGNGLFGSGVIQKAIGRMEQAEHQLVVFSTNGAAIVIDTAAPGFSGSRARFPNTEVLLIMSESGNLLDSLARVYGGEWHLLK